MEPKDLNMEEQAAIAQEEKEIIPEMQGEPVRETMERFKDAVPDPTTDVEAPAEPTEEGEVVEPPKAIEDPDNPITEMSIKQLTELMKQVAEMVKIMENQWNISKKEFQLTDTHMKKLYQYNETHRTEMAEDATPEEQANWDRFNGLNNIPEDVVTEIFGEGHPIIGVMHTQTVDRIKDCVSDFFSWMASVKEYRQIHDAYLELIELEEQKNIEQLKEIAEKEEDPEKKAKMEASIKLYYNRKYLEFLADPLTDKDKERLINAFKDEKKISYWLQRTRDKLKQIKVSEKFILEISQFEKRYLPEQYHKCSNMMLLYFMQTIVYSSMSDKDGEGRNKVICMVFALDGIIRKTWNEESTERVLTNIKAFLDQIIDLVPELPKEPHVDAPPIEE